MNKDFQNEELMIRPINYIFNTIITNGVKLE